MKMLILYDAHWGNIFRLVLLKLTKFSPIQNISVRMHQRIQENRGNFCSTKIFQKVLPNFGKHQKTAKIIKTCKNSPMRLKIERKQQDPLPKVSVNALKLHSFTTLLYIGSGCETKPPILKWDKIADS